MFKYIIIVTRLVINLLPSEFHNIVLVPSAVVTNGTEVTGDAKKRELNAQLKLKICEHQQQNAGLGQGQGQPVGGESLDAATTGGRKTPIVVTSRPFISNVKVSVFVGLDVLI